MRKVMYTVLSMLVVWAIVSYHQPTYNLTTTGTSTTSSTIQYTNYVHRTKVLHVGDSLTAFSLWASTPLYQKAGYDAVLRGYPGTALASPNTNKGDVQWLEYLPKLMVAHKPDVVVIELGTNDAFRGTDAVTFAKALDQVFKIIGDEIPVYWVNIAASCSRWPNVNQFGKLLNMVLDLAIWHDNLHILDLESVMCAHPDLYRQDNLHYTPKGEVLYVNTIINNMKEN